MRWNQREVSREEEEEELSASGGMKECTVKVESVQRMFQQMEG